MITSCVVMPCDFEKFIAPEVNPNIVHCLIFLVFFNFTSIHQFVHKSVTTCFEGTARSGKGEIAL